MNSERVNKMSSGSWLVVGLLLVGVVLAVVGLKYRKFPAERERERAPATTRVVE